MVVIAKDDDKEKDKEQDINFIHITEGQNDNQ
jgi:hypothetical protein